MTAFSGARASILFGAEHAEFSGAIEQALDRRRAPAGSAARRALIHAFELRANLHQGEVGIRASDAGDKGEETLAACSARGGTKQVGICEAFGDEAFDGALEALDAPVGQGGAIGFIALGVQHTHDVLPAMIGAHLPRDRQPMFGGVIDALEIVLASGVDDALDGLGIAGAELGIAADAAAFLGGAQPVLGAFPKERAHQLGDRAEHLQGKTPLRSDRVDRIGERFEMRALGVEFGDDRQEMR